MELPLPQNVALKYDDKVRCGSAHSSEPSALR